MFSHCSDSEQFENNNINKNELSVSSQINDYHSPKTPGKSKLNTFDLSETKLLKSLTLSQNQLNWQEITLQFNKFNNRQRPKQALYQHYKRVIQQGGAYWSQDDDRNLMNALLSTQKRQWSKIGLKINRSSDEVIKRLKHLKTKGLQIDNDRMP